MASLSPSVRAADTRPIELVPGRLWALGGTLALDGRVSFAPTVDGGYVSSNCYLIVEDGQALLVDTGIAAARDAILHQLSQLLAPEQQLSIFLTRAEFDTVGNLGAIGEAHPIAGLHTGGVTNPFDAFDMVHLAGAKPATVPARVERKPLRDVLEFTPNRHIAMVPPPIRMITTYWAFDRSTKTLFTSDAFSHGIVNTPGGASVLDDASAPFDSHFVAEFAYRKFWFLPHTHPGMLRRDLAGVFGTLEPEIVCPAYGSVLRGRDVVEQHFAAMMEALP